MQGCLDWQARGGGRIGLAPLDECLLATEAYRQHQDPLAGWWGDLFYEATLSPGGFTTSAALWKHYTDWCGENCVVRPVSSRRFATYLEGKGLVKKATTAARGWEGITLSSEQ
jgi:phage/plasmid-associated DNA primase